MPEAVRFPATCQSHRYARLATEIICRDLLVILYESLEMVSLVSVMLKRFENDILVWDQKRGGVV